MTPVQHAETVAVVNFLMPISTNRLKNDGTWEYSYDGEGSLTKKEISEGLTWTYGYDHRNQMTWAELRETDEGDLLLRVEFDYDVFGNRVEKRFDEDGNSTVDFTQRYAYDGWNPAKPSPIGNENWDVVFDLDEISSLTTRYLRGDVVDQIFARYDGEDAYWYLTDHLGSIRDIVDNSGNVVNTLAYDGFGNIIVETDDAYRGRYAWTGREYDVEIELQYNRARYYDATTGRWTSQDPLGFDAGDSNLYRYVKNTPIQWIDPSGLQQETPYYQKDTRFTYPAVDKVIDEFVLENFKKEYADSFAKQVINVAKLAHQISKDLAFLGVLGQDPTWKPRVDTWFQGNRNLQQVDYLFLATVFKRISDGLKDRTVYVHNRQGNGDRIMLDIKGQPVNLHQWNAKAWKWTETHKEAEGEKVKLAMKLDQRVRFQATQVDGEFIAAALRGTKTQPATRIQIDRPFYFNGKVKLGQLEQMGTIFHEFTHWFADLEDITFHQKRIDNQTVFWRNPAEITRPAPLTTDERLMNADTYAGFFFNFVLKKG